MEVGCIRTFQNPSRHHSGGEWECNLLLSLLEVRHLFTLDLVSILFIYLTQSSRPSIGIHRARHDDSTSNLKRHVQLCTPVDSAQSQALRVYAQGSQYSQVKHRMKIALWVARRNRPFSIVEDEELLDIFHDLNAACITPGRRTVARDVREIFLLSRKNVSALLQVCIHLVWRILNR